MSVQLANFECKGFEVFGVGSSEAEARCEAYRQLMSAVDSLLHTKMGMNRVDQNGSHSGTSGYYYQSYVNRSSSNNTVYLTVRTNNVVTNSNVGLYVGITSEIPTDGSSTVTTSPYAARTLSYQTVQVGSSRTFSIYGEYIMLLNDEATMCDFNSTFSNYSTFLCGEIVGEGIYWPTTSAIYYPNGDVKYLGYIGSSHYMLNDDYNYQSGVETHSDLLVCSAPITTNSNRTASLDYSNRFKEILGFSGGAFRDGDFVQAKDPEILNAADYYLVYRNNLYLFDVQPLGDWGNDS